MKETDRIAAMAEGLQALGAVVEPTPDGMRVQGGLLHGGTVQSFGDHRIAMALTMAMAAAQGAAIEPAWNAKDGETLDEDVALRMRPLVSKFFELCEDHGVTRTAEGDWNRIENQEKRLGTLLGLE